MATVLERMNDEAAAIVDKALDSLVQVHSGAGAFGAGVICHPDGLIVTNAHVIHGPTPMVRLRDGRALAARILALDRRRDLAALAINASNLKAIPFGQSPARPGVWVLSLGHPWGVSGAASAGAVIGLEGQDGAPPGVGSAGQWLVAALPLRPGHSGGPMVNSEGRLVGINTMITGPRVSAAVPIGAVKSFLKEAIAVRPAAAA